MQILSYISQTARKQNKLKLRAVFKGLLHTHACLGLMQFWPLHPRPTVPQVSHNFHGFCTRQKVLVCHLFVHNVALRLRPPQAKFYAIESVLLHKGYFLVPVGCEMCVIASCDVWNLRLTGWSTFKWQQASFMANGWSRIIIMHHQSFKASLSLKLFKMNPVTPVGRITFKIQKFHFLFPESVSGIIT